MVSLFQQWTAATVAASSLLVLWNAPSANAQTIATTLVVVISIDSDGRITFDQNGSVNLPPGGRDAVNSEGPFFLRQGSVIEREVGALAATDFDIYDLNAGAEISFACVNGVFGSLDDLAIDPSIPTVFFAEDDDDEVDLSVPDGYVSGTPGVLNGMSASTATFSTLADAGFVVGETCFVEYDSTGNGVNDSRIEMIVDTSPSSSPSGFPSASPSNSPSASPSASPTLCLSRSTKSPGKRGKGMKMQKTTKTDAPIGCMETKSPGKGMMMRGKGKKDL